MCVCTRVIMSPDQGPDAVVECGAVGALCVVVKVRVMASSYGDGFWRWLLVVASGDGDGFW